jgi:hypothetical protein
VFNGVGHDNGLTEKGEGEARSEPTVSGYHISSIYHHWYLQPQRATKSPLHWFQSCHWLKKSMARHPTNGRGRNSTWITVHRLRCTVRRFDDQRGYFCDTVRHPCTCEDGKRQSLAVRATEPPALMGGCYCAGRRKKIFAWGTNKMDPLVSPRDIQPFYDRKRAKIEILY